MLTIISFRSCFSISLTFILSICWPCLKFRRMFCYKSDYLFDTCASRRLDFVHPNLCVSSTLLLYRTLSICVLGLFFVCAKQPHNTLCPPNQLANKYTHTKAKYYIHRWNCSHIPQIIYRGTHSASWPVSWLNRPYTQRRMQGTQRIRSFSLPLCVSVFRCRFSVAVITPAQNQCIKWNYAIIIGVTNERWSAKIQ